MDNDIQGDRPNDRCVHGLFEAQAVRSPAATAVVWGDRRLTYRGLNEQANRLAGYLRRRGVGPEVRVGICLERSPAMIVGLLGILKAGGAYVPLDPAYPPERLAFMLADAQAPLLLSRRSLLAPLPAPGAAIVCLDEEGERIARESPANKDGPVAAGNLAYVIYTSGSTGKPKGAAVEHRSVVHLIDWALGYFSPDQRAGVLAASSLSFDLSVFELFVALAGGGAVILADHLLSLPHLPAAGEITLINTVPSTLAALLRAAALPPGAGTVILAGEPLPRALVEQLYRQPAVRDVYNFYGPTEATVYCTGARMAPGEAGAPVIGTPVAGAAVFLLDPGGGGPAGGEVGELCVGGPGLARGYLNAPELTAAKFIPRAGGPGDGRPGGRLYRTGDRARLRPDGRLEFLGRLDRQVKIRGCRIELGEIEAALAGHPAVRECVVAAREAAPGEPRLVAYVVRDEGRGMRDENRDEGRGMRDEKIPSLPHPSSLIPRPLEAPHPSSLVPHPSSLASELRAFLRERLAEALVPATYVLLEALPLTPSGKVDRQALPAPDGAGPAPRQPFVAPRDAWEQQLAGLWARLLAVQPIGVNDDFFELGGHSLLAARLLLEIEAIWGRRLSLAALLPAPTIARVASLLREAGDPAPWRSLVPIRPAGARPPLFFVHGIGGGVLGYRELARHLPPNQPFYGLQSPGLAGLPVTAARVEEMAARYLAEIRSVQPVGPYSLGGFSFGGLVAFEMARQLEAQAEAVALLALVDTDGPPPVRSLTVAARRLLGRARRVGKGTPRGAPPGDPLARALREVEQAHRQALAAYVPRAYAGRITLFRARERPAAADPALGWGQVAAGGVEVREVPGDHLSMVEYPHLLTLARELSECLEAAQAAGVGRSGVQAFRRSGPVMDEHEHEHEHDPNPRMPERPNA